MTPQHVALLRCPRCQGPLEYVGTTARGHLHAGNLLCRTCPPPAAEETGQPRAWAVQNGLPHFIEPGDVRGFEALVHLVYELFAPFHDFGVRYCLPLLTFASEEETRERFVAPIGLEDLARNPPADRPLRILDVGIGGGGNLPYLARHLPAGVDVEIWGVDFSRGMLAQCERRLRTWAGSPVYLMLGDAHALPFPAASFDRVLHVGGINAYSDPARALAEMARVARPGTPIVVGDEQLDEVAARNWYQWLTFHWITALDGTRRAPVEHIPRGATDLRVTQVSSFYYAMSFRMPDGA